MNTLKPQYIRKVLSERPVNLDVQIVEPKRKEQKYIMYALFRYKFEQSNDGGLTFDTRDEFFYGIEKDFNKGIPVPEEF